MPCGCVLKSSVCGHTQNAIKIRQNSIRLWWRADNIFVMMNNKIPLSVGISDYFCEVQLIILCFGFKY
jgi:hypothetical protein